jgi:hypothetical protein
MTFTGNMRIEPVLLSRLADHRRNRRRQHHYYGSSDPNCSKAGTITVTILAGPLNYEGYSGELFVM